MAILDPDTFQFPPTLKKVAIKPRRIAYLSVGEIGDYRWYWPLVSGKEFVLEANPNWPGDHYIDVRSRQWQELLLRQVIPKILAKGYEGLFLDTLDTAEYLEWKDPKKYAGSMSALENWVKALRRRFPKILIVTNNAFPLLRKWGDIIDGALVEDLYTRYDFPTKSYGKIPESESREKEMALEAFSKQFRRPVFVLLYAEPKQKELIRWSIARTRRIGFLPYVATVSLNRIGLIAPNE